MDRQRIEKRDFPLAAEGYVRDAVDAHLAAIAEEVSTGSAQPPGSLAETAAARVRAIVGEAEARGAEIARQAELAAARTRDETDREQRRVREEAVQRTRTEIREVASTLERIVLGLDEAERDVRSVIALLREQARGLAEELALVDREMDRAYEALRPAGPAGSNGGEAATAPGGPEAAAELEDGAPETGGDDSGASEAGPGERGPAGFSTPSTGDDAGEGTGSAPPEAGGDAGDGAGFAPPDADGDAGEGTGSAPPSAGDAAEAPGAPSAPAGDAAPGEAPDGPAAGDPPAPSERI